MEKPKEFKINGKTLIIKPLTIRQVKDLVELLGDVNITETTALNDIANQLLEEKINELMAIVFRGQDTDGIDWMDVPYETVDEIAQFFFEVNPRLIKRLKGLYLSLVQVAGTQTA